MSEEEITGTSSAVAEGTADAGSSGTQEGVVNQESSEIATRLASIEAEKQEIFQAKVALEQELAEAKRRGEELDKNLRAQQRNTTVKLQEAAEQRKQAENINNLKRELMAEQHQQRTILTRLSEVMLEEDQRKQLSMDLEKAQLESTTKAWQEYAQQLTQPQPAPQFDVETYKAQLFQTYASDSTLDYNDPRIDWHPEANGLQEWLPRFRMTIGKLEKEKASLEQKAFIDNIQKQNLDNLEALKAKEAALIGEYEKKLLEATKTTEDSVKRAEEERLRRNGIDAGSTLTGSDGEAPNSFAKALAEIPDSLLNTTGGQIEYNKRLNAAKAKFNK
jgi:predicted RNase H-like nuclease (RuvC/YqgF family)